MKLRDVGIVALLGLALSAPTSLNSNPWDHPQPYGTGLMTPGERQEYRRLIGEIESEQAQYEFWIAHVERMQGRAIERGLEIPRMPFYRAPGEPRRPVGRAPYFEAAMTEEEIAVYHAEMRALTDSAAKNAYIVDHVVRMRRRGFERGLAVPGTRDWDFAFEGGKRPPDDIP
jgi:hypothetical protein